MKPKPATPTSTQSFLMWKMLFREYGLITSAPSFTNLASGVHFSSYSRIISKNAPFVSEQPVITHPPTTKKMVFLRALPSTVPYSWSPLMASSKSSIHLSTQFSFPTTSVTPIWQHLLQNTIHQVNIWLSSRGFRFTPFKTNFIFSKTQTTNFLPPSLALNQINIPRVDTIRVLALHFNFRHSRTPHIRIIRAKCLRAFDILRILSHIISMAVIAEPFFLCTKA